MFQSKKPNSSRGVRHARKFRLRTDASRDTRCSRALNTQLPRVIAERAIHHVTQEKSNLQAQYWPNVGPVQAARLGNATPP